MAATATLLASPTGDHPTQLWFDWGSDELELRPASLPETGQRVVTRRRQTVARATRAKNVARRGAADERSGVLAASPNAVQHEEPIAPRMVRGKRGGEPVRIGHLMIELLKSYGITDAEIAEGLQAYASAH